MKRYTLLMGRGSESLQSTNLFYDKPLKRAPEFVRTQAEAIRALNLLHLDLKNSFEAVVFEPTDEELPAGLEGCRHSEKPVYSGTRIWGVQVPALPGNWWEQLPFTSERDPETRKQAREAIRDYQASKRSRVAVRAELETSSFGSSSVDASIVRITAEGNQTKNSFGSFKTGAVRAVEALAGSLGKNAEWFCYTIPDNNPQKAVKRLVYLAPAENDAAFSASSAAGKRSWEMIGWVNPLSFA